MSNFMNDTFGPLGKEYCQYFYIVSIFFFLLYVVALIGLIVFIVKKNKNILEKEHLPFLFHSVMLTFSSLLSYIVYRLLNTMCMNSVH